MINDKDKRGKESKDFIDATSGENILSVLFIIHKHTNTHILMCICTDERYILYIIYFTMCSIYKTGSKIRDIKCYHLIKVEEENYFYSIQNLLPKSYLSLID